VEAGETRTDTGPFFRALSHFNGRINREPAPEPAEQTSHGKITQDRG
jgi:hypothetical protein